MSYGNKYICGNVYSVVIIHVVLYMRKYLIQKHDAIRPQWCKESQIIQQYEMSPTWFAMYYIVFERANICHFVLIV